MSLTSKIFSLPRFETFKTQVERRSTKSWADKMNPTQNFLKNASSFFPIEHWNISMSGFILEITILIQCALVGVKVKGQVPKSNKEKQVCTSTVYLQLVIRCTKLDPISLSQVVLSYKYFSVMLCLLLVQKIQSTCLFTYKYSHG